MILTVKEEPVRECAMLLTVQEKPVRECAMLLPAQETYGPLAPIIWWDPIADR